MGENNININQDNITGQISSLQSLVSGNLASDKISEINTLLANNLGETATALQNISSTLQAIEESMTGLISSTSSMLSYVDVAYESADTAETSEG